MVGSCRELGLCDQAGSLTRLGEDVADTDQAPVPEQGVYDVWAVHHPLLGSRMLHVERVSSVRDGRFQSDITPIPVEPEQGKVFVSAVDPQNRFVLLSFPSNNDGVGALVRHTQQRCRLRWTLDWTSDGNDLRMDGDIATNSGARPIKHKPERVAVDLWQLMADWALGPLRRYGRWSTQSRRLEVALASLSTVEQESFVKELEFGTVEILSLGQWQTTGLSEVPIGPGTARDAAAWAMARLDRSLRGEETPRTRAEIRRLFVDLTEDTPLAPFKPTLPDHSALLASYRDAPEVFWRLAAPVDLAPFGPCEQELDGMAVGEETSDAAPTPDTGDGKFFMPPGSGWSMRMLMDVLATGHSLRRVLLVDRYVRGDDNLASLQLLVMTLADQGSPAVDIWTGDSVKNDTFAQIQQITGRRPRRYRDIFGRSFNPHDRYLVVVPQRGDPFAWSLTNSPLDARVDGGVSPSPTTPLRWRDLSGTRLSVGQLVPQMVIWVSGDRR